MKAEIGGAAADTVASGSDWKRVTVGVGGARPRGVDANRLRWHAYLVERAARPGREDLVGAKAALVFGGSPGNSVGEKAKVAGLRSLRTLLQGVAGAFPAAGAGTVVLSTGYWETLGYSCLAAVVTALVSLLNNVASFLPQDPTQTTP